MINDTSSAETIADTIIMPCFVAISSVSISHLYHVIGNNTARVCANFNFSLNLLCLCISAWQFSVTFDILIQGKYAEIMRNRPGVGTSITTFKLFFACLGTVVVQSYVGPLSDKVRMLDDDILWVVRERSNNIIRLLLTNDPASFFLCCL